MRDQHASRAPPEGPDSAKKNVERRKDEPPLRRVQTDLAAPVRCWRRSKDLLFVRQRAVGVG